eukprot:1954281-Rhodomonas_salina.2
MADLSFSGGLGGGGFGVCAACAACARTSGHGQNGHVRGGMRDSRGAGLYHRAMVGSAGSDSVGHPATAPAAVSHHPHVRVGGGGGGASFKNGGNSVSGHGVRRTNAGAPRVGGVGGAEVGPLAVVGAKDLVLSEGEFITKPERVNVYKSKNNVLAIIIGNISTGDLVVCLMKKGHSNFVRCMDVASFESMFVKTDHSISLWGEFPYVDVAVGYYDSNDVDEQGFVVGTTYHSGWVFAVNGNKASALFRDGTVKKDMIVEKTKEDMPLTGVKMCHNFYDRFFPNGHGPPVRHTEPVLVGTKTVRSINHAQKMGYVKRDGVGTRH